MVKIQFELPDELSKFLDVLKDVHCDPDKSKTIIRILTDKYNESVELLDKLKEK